MSKVSCVSSGKALKAPLRMARAELLLFNDYLNKKTTADHIKSCQRRLFFSGAHYTFLLGMMIAAMM